jgi:hypothetical protein
MISDMMKKADFVSKKADFSLKKSFFLLLTFIKKYAKI